MRLRKIATAMLVLASLQVVLCLASWVLSAMWPHCGISNVLGGEGLRWLFGRFASSLAAPPLVWILLLSMAAGILRHCGIGRLLRRGHRWQYRERMALTAAAIMALVCLGMAVALVLPPRSVLLSATGTLWPSPLADAAIPMLALAICIVAVAYGVVAGRFSSAWDVCQSFVWGIGKSAPLLLLYVLIAQLFHTLCYVMPHGQSLWFPAY